MSGTPLASHWLQRPPLLLSRGTRMPDPRRLIVLISVLVTHVAVLALLMEEGKRRHASHLSDAPIALVWLAPLTPDQSRRWPETVAPTDRRSNGSVGTTTPRAHDRQAPRAATASTSASPRQLSGTDLSAPSGESATPVAPPVDWQGELGSAAARQLAREGKKRRRAAALEPPGVPPSLAAPPPRLPWDGWDYAATHRYATTSEGAPYVNVNDHCVLTFPFVYSTMYRFGCNLGTLAPRTDLFQHAKDPPAARSE